MNSYKAQFFETVYKKKQSKPIIYPLFFALSDTNQIVQDVIEL